MTTSRLLTGKDLALSTQLVLQEHIWLSSHTFLITQACEHWILCSEPGHSHMSMFPFACPTARVPYRNCFFSDVFLLFRFTGGRGKGGNASAVIADGA